MGYDDVCLNRQMFLLMALSKDPMERKMAQLCEVQLAPILHQIRVIIIN